MTKLTPDEVDAAIAGGSAARLDGDEEPGRAPPDTRSWFEKLIARIDPWFSGLFQGRRR